MRSALPAWFYSLIRRETVGFEPYTAHPRWSLQILRARPVGPSELRARAHGNRAHYAQELPAHHPPTGLRPTHGPCGEAGKIAPTGLLRLVFSKKKYPLWPLRGHKSAIFRRKNTPYGADLPEIRAKKWHIYHKLALNYGFLIDYASIIFTKFATNMTKNEQIRAKTALNH